MTPQEQQMIDGLIDRIRNTQVTDKDLDAERYLQQNLATIPDALYILAQTVIVQQYGLQQAQQQIQQLQTALDEASQHVQQSSGGSFLSKIFGGPSTSQPLQTQYQPVNNPGYPPPYAPAYAPAYTQPAYPSGGGGFLRGALQTAAGVAIGEAAFESMESLFHGFGGSQYGYEHPGETVVNNYYDDPAQHEHHVDDSNFYNPADDASRQDLGGQGSSQNFADSSSGNDIGGFGNDNSDFVDNSGFDDSGFDDSSNFDNGGNDNS
jgi:uncharacterized protein